MSYPTKAKELSFAYYLPIVLRRRTDGFVLFSRVLVENKMQKSSSKVADSISYDNHNNKHAFYGKWMYLSLPPTRQDLTQGQKSEGRLKRG